MTNKQSATRPPTLQWHGDVDGQLVLLDQRKLPTSVEFISITTVEQAWTAIRNLTVRGAPAIGVTAAYAMVLAARAVPPTSQAVHLIESLTKASLYLRSARPTAVNLEWAVETMLHVAIAERGIGVRPMMTRLLHEAKQIHADDTAMCLAIGQHGAPLIKPNTGVLTHCNAGALACSNHGTALSIMYEAQRRGTPFRVYADETRPVLQGARLTAYELHASNIDVTLICDNMAGLLMKQGKIQLVVVGADRIAANGDTANKIGTYAVATLAKAHGIPFVVAAPSSTFDLIIKSGDEIPIEERAPEEITHVAGTQLAPDGIKVYNPAFDVTPAHLIHAIITERGLISPVNEKTVAALIN